MGGGLRAICHVEVEVSVVSQNVMLNLIKQKKVFSSKYAWQETKDHPVINLQYITADILNEMLIFLWSVIEIKGSKENFQYPRAIT